MRKENSVHLKTVTFRLDTLQANLRNFNVNIFNILRKITIFL